MRCGGGGACTGEGLGGTGFGGPTALAGLASGAGAAAGAMMTGGGGGGGGTSVTSIAGGSGMTGGWPQVASTADSTRAWTARLPTVAVRRSRRRRLAARPASFACASTLIDSSELPKLHLHGQETCMRGRIVAAAPHSETGV